MIKKLLKFIVLLIGLTIATPAFGQVFDVPEESPSMGVALKIMPSTVEEVVDPGGEVKKIFLVENMSDVPLPIKSYVREFGASDEVGGVSIEEDILADKLDIQNWVKIVEPDFILYPNEKRKVEVVISPPKDLSPGGYYGTVFFEILSGDYQRSGSVVEIGGRVGALLFLVISGETSEEASIEEFRVGNYFGIFSSPELSFKTKNSGNVHVRPEGVVSVKNMITGRTISRNIEEYTVLPNRSRKVEIILNEMIWPGIYKVQIEEIYGIDKKVITADDNIIYLHAYHLIVIILLSLFLGVVLSSKLRRRISMAVRVIVWGSHYK